MNFLAILRNANQDWSYNDFDEELLVSNYSGEKKNRRGEAINKGQSVCYTWDVIDRKRKSVIKMKGYLFIFSRILSKKP